MQPTLSYASVADDTDSHHVCVAPTAVAAPVQRRQSKKTRREKTAINSTATKSAAKPTSRDNSALTTQPSPLTTTNDSFVSVNNLCVSSPPDERSTISETPKKIVSKQRYALPVNRYVLLQDFEPVEDTTDACEATVPSPETPVAEHVSTTYNDPGVVPSTTPAPVGVACPMVFPTTGPSGVTQRKSFTDQPFTGRLTLRMRRQAYAMIGHNLQYTLFSSCMKRIPNAQLMCLHKHSVHVYLSTLSTKQDLQWSGAFMCPRLRHTDKLFSYITQHGFIHLHSFKHHSLFYRPPHGQHVLYSDPHVKVHTINTSLFSVPIDSEQATADGVSAPLYRYAIGVRHGQGSTDVQAWFDSCASSSCVSAAVVKKLNLRAITVDGMELALGDSHIIDINQICMVKTSLGTVKCIVVPDLPCDLIFGLPWLKYNNPAIDWNTGIMTLHDMHCLYPLGRHVKSNLSPLLLSAMQFRKLSRNKQYDSFLVTVDIVSHPAQHTACEVRIAPEHPHHDTLQPIMHEFAGVFDAPKQLPPDRGEFNFKIQLHDHTPFARTPFRLSPAEELEMKKQIAELLDSGFISPSISPWAAPVLFVRKKPDPTTGETSLRMCIDYRGLNAKTVRDTFPLPNVAELLNIAAGHKFYTTLDLKSGYHQLLLDPESRSYTTFSCKFGTFQYNVLPFGLSNGPPHFCRLVASLFGNVPGVCTYMDDILIFADTLEEHMSRLRTVLDILHKNQLYLKFSKCAFVQPSVKYLGHVLSDQGLHTDSTTVQAVKDFPVPSNVQQLRSFLGLTNYYRKFINNYATLAQPLTDLLKGTITRSISVLWTEQLHGTAFTTLKNALCTAPILCTYNPARETCIFTDASQHGVGVALCQRSSVEDIWHVVEYASKRFSDAESRYPVHEQELLALVFGLRHFRHYLLGLHFTCYTDHRTLTKIHTQASLSPRQSRWLETLEEYNYTVVYTKGADNVVADALSRLFAIVNTGHSDFLQSVRDAYAEDTQLHDFKKYLHSYDSLYFHGAQLYVPVALRTRCMRDHHDTPWCAHPGFARMFELLSRDFWWPKMRADIKQYVKTCPSCQQMKPVNTARMGLHHAFDHPDTRWHVVSCDLIVDLPQSDGFDSVITFVDKCSKMTHFIPCNKNITAMQFADVFVSHIFRLHGMPDVIISDRDTKFTSAFWQQFTEAIGIRLNMSTAYYAQTDGQTERQHRSVEECLRHFVAFSQDKWSSYLPIIEFALNNLQNRTTGSSPFFLNYGQHPKVPGSVLFSRSSEAPVIENPDHVPLLPTVQDRINKLYDVLDKASDIAAKSMRAATDYVNKHRTDVNFTVGDEVLLSTRNFPDSIFGSSKLRCQYIGPFRILQQIGQVAFKLELPPLLGRIHPVFHAHLLKRYNRDENLHPVQMPPVPEIIDGFEEYEVEAVLAKRRRGRGVQYLVKFLGYPFEHCEWLPLSKLQHCKECIAEFEDLQQQEA